ncbi:hypothetical protein D9757_011246 [Collybiopsis confluens]|uniref:Uncharacterized protein n=1 Tax=Collybiopsis confluens TaxID=2823264 RepID=A0A8H5GMQ8_9AGAR|nr:hypothetical protein D9757_011246 [Collybiopsis confluens]
MAPAFSKPIEDPESTRRCSHCLYSGQVKTFPQKKNLTYTKKCHDCAARDKATTKKQNGDGTSSNKENHPIPLNTTRRVSEPRKRGNWCEFLESLNKVKELDLDLNDIVVIEQLCADMEANLELQNEEEDLDTEAMAMNKKLEISSVAPAPTSRWLLCKHLVRAVNQKTQNLPLNNLPFFCSLRRYHFAPFYRIPGIHETVDQIKNRAEESSSSSHIRHLTPELKGFGQPGKPSEDAHERSSPFCSDDEGKGSERMFFSPNSLAKTRKNFEELMNTAGQSRGVHPKLGQYLKRAMDEVDKVGGDIGIEKRKRKMPRTWKDSNEITLYLD